MRRFILVAICCALVGSGTAHAAPTPRIPPPTTTVSMTEFAFTPQKPTLQLDEAYMFSNDGTVDHGAKIWQVGTFTAAAGGFDVGATALRAGSYPFHCQFHPDQMTGLLKVAPTLDTFVGPPGTDFGLSWATGALPVGTKMKVQMRKVGKDWIAAGSGTGTGTAMSPTKLGTYEARVMFVAANGKTSKWSPKVSFDVISI